MVHEADIGTTRRRVVAEYNMAVGERENKGSSSAFLARAVAAALFTRHWIKVLKPVTR